jgi:hypothetical protein
MQHNKDITNTNREQRSLDNTLNQQDSMSERSDTEIDSAK